MGELPSSPFLSARFAAPLFGDMEEPDMFYSTIWLCFGLQDDLFVLIDFSSWFFVQNF